MSEEIDDIIDTLHDAINDYKSELISEQKKEHYEEQFKETIKNLENLDLDDTLSKSDLEDCIVFEEFEYDPTDDDSEITFQILQYILKQFDNSCVELNLDTIPYVSEKENKIQSLTKTNTNQAERIADLEIQNSKYSSLIAENSENIEKISNLSEIGKQMALEIDKLKSTIEDLNIQLQEKEKVIQSLSEMTNAIQ